MRKCDLSREGAAYLAERIFAAEHEFDSGPLQVWDVAGYLPNLFAVIEVDSGMPIGVLHRAGPSEAMDVGWWLDKRYRGCGYGSEMIDALALMLIAEGVTGIGAIRVITHQGEYDKASRSLVRRLAAHFG